MAKNLGGATTMMGGKPSEARLFYSFSLEEKVPGDHLLRVIKENVDLSFVYKLARPYYSQTGQPSINPVVLLNSLAIYST
ncbi:hypothetical protein ACFLWX_03830 [Chloroflexota bacterium]